MHVNASQAKLDERQVALGCQLCVYACVCTFMYRDLVCLQCRSAKDSASGKGAPPFSSGQEPPSNMSVLSKRP